jgi:hypothetical protein
VDWIPLICNILGMLVYVPVPGTERSLHATLPLAPLLL